MSGEAGGESQPTAPHIFDKNGRCTFADGGGRDAGKEKSVIPSLRDGKGAPFRASSSR